MDNQTRNFINTLADAVRKAYKITIPVGDMGTIIFRLGGKIIYNARVVDGRIEKKRNGFIIEVEDGNCEHVRTRFTIAHELGHLFLHMGYLIDSERWKNVDASVYNRLGMSREESQANEFAAAFLMPRGEFIKVAKEENLDTEKIAKYFNVSQLAVINRAKFLHLLEW